jgi:hypothetical protein
MLLLGAPTLLLLLLLLCNPSFGRRLTTRAHDTPVDAETREGI